MSRYTPEQIREMLRAQRTERSPEPPADLLDRIGRDIPGHLAGDKEHRERGARSRWTARRVQLVAASLFAAVAATVVVSRVLVEKPGVRPEAVVEENRSELAETSRPILRERAVAVPIEAVELVETMETAVPTEVTAGQPSSPAPEEMRFAGRDSDLDESDSSAGASGTQGVEAPGNAVRQPQSVAVVGGTRLQEAPPPPAAPPVEAGELKEERLPRRGDRTEVMTDETPQGELSAAPGSAAEGMRGARQKRLEESLPVAVEPPPPDTGIVFGTSEGPTATREAGRRSIVPKPVVMPSTGGTAEPNDAPYGDVFFESAGVNPFIDTEDDRLSTFGLDVDTASYTVVRRYLGDGNLPPAAAVRVEEFINYFDYGDPAPRGGDFAVVAEGAPSPFAQGPRYQLLRFAIKARDIAPRHRRPATLVFVVDTSGSMKEGNRLDLVKRALTLLLDELERDDRVGLVEYSDRARVLVEPTRDRYDVERALRRLRPGGSTNAEEGLLLGYELADEFFRRDGINRVILCSDGVANVGRTGPGSILERIGREADRGIEITTVGVGMGNYNDVLMEQLADRGNGRYAYIDDLEEARRIFVEDLTGTLQTVARDAKVQVEFNPAVVSRYRLLGYENRDIADHRFRDDTIDAGEIGAGHTVTALYEVKLHDGASRRADLATLHLRWESVEDRRVREIDETIRATDLERSWRHASPALRLASVVAEFAEILKGSYWARESSLEDLVERAERLERELRDAEVSDLVDLMIQASRIGTDRSAWDE